MHVNFLTSSFTGVGGEWDDRRMHTGRQAFLNRCLFPLISFQVHEKKKLIIFSIFMTVFICLCIQIKQKSEE